ncbi:MAG: aromatic amino acid ammonia-lyase [Polyangiales bacterium]
MHETLQVVVGEQRITASAVERVALGSSEARLSDDAVFVGRLQRGADVIARRLAERVPTYGVNTGFGASVRNPVPFEAALSLARNLPRYHGCGVEPFLSHAEARAVLLVRASSLAAGYSGVRPLLITRLLELLQHDIVPLIPARGSVGASGDLTPLSYVAALLVGERQASWRGQVLPAHEALAQAGLSPLELQPKESLAIMNGTSVMSALACLACERAERLAQVASALTALCVSALAGQHGHYDARIFAAKAHAGQARSAAQIRSYLGERDPLQPRAARIQERYSLRCAPHVIGVLLDALPFCRNVLETEINGASDNPLIDPDSGDVLHGGNFYGGHVAMIADMLKTAVANVADLLDRQMVLLNAPETNQGLPENLVAVEGPERFAHHGFKAMEITASALTAEALKLSMPASVFSRSTEGHNQDKVSMGLHAVQDLQQILQLTETVAAIHAMTAAQALELRGLSHSSPALRALHAALREHTSFVKEDRPLDAEIVAVTAFLRAGLHLPSFS